MRGVVCLSLLLTACATPELSAEGSRVRWADHELPSCRPIATLREAEGGGLRSYAANRDAAAARLRNEAARIGGNAVVLLREVHGGSEAGRDAFATGVAGLTSPTSPCSNCVILAARAYACEGSSAPAEEAPPPAMTPVPAAPPVIIVIDPPSR